ncbi:sensor histidine kinase [Winogradskyella sp.]|uniref:sensor histidine kinase n=1 Tax=Winogradskyella sp. TaxID=1883156 RepID=UPI0025CF825E|nr:sensor histidine kinase [Winogradskyella sp.]
MKNRIIFLTVVISISLFKLASAQLYDITRYADDNGLPSRAIIDIVQDSKGFLWVAGNNGFYKFDGQQFKAFYAILNDTTGLRDNKINTVLAAKNGKIWIATPKGLHVLENDTISYVTPPKNLHKDASHIIDLFEDSNQNIWVSTYDGFYIIDKITGEIRDFPELRKSPNYGPVIWGITEDKNGNIWVCRSWKPPLVAKKDTYEFKELSFNLEDDLDKKKNINPFKYIQYNETVFLIDSGSGLLKGTLENDSILIVSKFRDANGKAIGEEFIYNSIIDSEQNIWTATWKNRFKKYKYTNNQLIEQNVISTNGLLGMSGHVRSVYEDSQKNIWLSNANGLYKLTSNKSNIVIFPPKHIKNCFEETFNVTAITEDENNHIWVTTTKDLYRFNKSDILEGLCPKDYIHIKNENFIKSHALFIDSQNRLWIGTEGGLFITQLNSDYEPGKFIHYTTKNGLPHNWSFDIHEENKLSYWVGNYTRLVNIKFENNTLKNSKITTYNSSKNRDDALVNSFTMDIEEDKDGQLWIGTFSGLSKLVSKEGLGVFKNYESEFGKSDQLSNNTIKKIFNDSKDRLWIATQAGLNLYNKTSDTFLQFGRQHGLPSDYILGISEDSKGSLWITTTNGICKAKYNNSEKRFIDIVHLTNKNGLADNITNKNALYIDADDNILAGSNKGLSVINNLETTIEETPFNLTLTKLENIHSKKQGFVSIKNRLKNNALELPYIENSIRLNYAVLDFSNIENNRYRHKILPLNEDWIETNTTSELTYYNLSPGTYQIILDGSNNQNKWSNNPLKIDLVILPPFWKSNLALFSYGLLILGILRLFYIMRIRKRMNKLKQQVKLERALVNEREQLRQENTADFHDELGSKVTKISLFLTLAERTINDNKDPSEWFTKIRTNIKDLSGSFRDLLWVIDPKKDSLQDVFLRLKDYGEDIFNNGEKNFSAKGHLNNQLHQMLDPQTKKQIVMIFKEAMNNCAKYSQCKNVELIIKFNEQYSSFKLIDDGIGFDVEKKSKGRGLKNMILRAKKMNADIIINSDNKGTSISLNRIPHMSDHFKEKEV